MASAISAPPPGGELDHVASTPKAVLGCIAFALFWIMAVFPSVRFLPIGRTAGAVMSAALMVAFKVLTPSEAFAAVNLPTVGLLFGTMIVSTFLERAGAFEYLGWLLAWKSLGGADLLCRLCIFSAFSAALLTNDTTCVILTSFILALCRARGLPPQPYLIGLATSANIGSALTPIGNPQNLIISINGRVSFGRFLVGLVAPVVVGVAVNMLGLLVVFARRLSKKRLRKRLAETGLGELGVTTVEGRQSEMMDQGIVNRRSSETGSGLGLEMTLGTDLGTGLETGLGQNGETGLRGQLGVDESRETSDGVLRETVPTEIQSGNGLEETGTGPEPDSRSRFAERQSSGIVVLVDEDTGVSSRPDGSPGMQSGSNTPLRIEILTRTYPPGVISRPDKPPGLSSVSDTPPSPGSLSPALRNLTPGNSFSSDTAIAQNEISDGFRIRSKPRPHQVEVVVPFPDLEHREGFPAVAPTWRGRLKRLRKKRPRWFFKASVYLVVVGMLAALLAGLDLPWVAMGAAVILIVLDFRDAEETLHQVSYSLLVFFSGMFIAVEGFNRTGIPGQIWAWLEPHARLDSAPETILLAVVVTLLSNVASNVPTVLLLGPRVAASAASTAGISETYAWLFLAFTSTVAGNLTMVGSAANLIVSEEAFRAKDEMKYKLSFWNHLRYGLPSTIIVLAVGIPLING